MDYITGPVRDVVSSVINMDSQKAIRLVIIVCAYIFARNIASRHLTKKQLESRVRHDEERIQREHREGLIEDPDSPAARATAAATGFGWGKATRRKVQRQKEMFEQAVDELKRKQELGYDSDDEIADLLVE
ncbi:Pga2 protein [Maudiozyma humilis]|uniref:Pga2 protein n=1 Tax=Maudiozyma humilis TaxID=51915 RepID=A0AAV5RSK7_MAUHU|nr:Pga2 protein [Kazachstania humilis]